MGQNLLCLSSLEDTEYLLRKNGCFGSVRRRGFKTGYLKLLVKQFGTLTFLKRGGMLTDAYLSRNNNDLHPQYSESGCRIECDLIDVAVQRAA